MRVPDPGVVRLFDATEDGPVKRGDVRVGIGRVGRRGDGDGRKPDRALQYPREQFALHAEGVPLAHLVAAAHAARWGSPSGFEPRRARHLCPDAELRVGLAVAVARQQLGARAPRAQVGGCLGAFVRPDDGRALRVRRAVVHAVQRRLEYRRVAAWGLRDVHVHRDARTQRAPEPGPCPVDGPVVI